MTLIEFYNKIIKSLGLGVDADGYILVSNKEDAVRLTAKDIPLALPTEEHINNVMAVDKDTGKLNITRILFNPLNEMSLGTESTTLNKIRVVIERKIEYSLVIIGEMLLMLASNKELQNKTTLEINKFLGEINKANGVGIKEIVDANTIKNWNKLYSHAVKENKGMVSLYIKKKGVSNAVKHNRLAVISSPALDKLNEMEKGDKIFGMTISRRKDLEVFKILLNFLFKHLDENGVMSEGSNDSTAPAFVSAFKIYIKLSNRLNKLSTDLKAVSTERYDLSYLPNKVTLKELENISIFNREIDTIPSDVDITRTQKIEESRQIMNVTPATMSGTDAINNSPLSGIPKVAANAVTTMQPEIAISPLNQSYSTHAPVSTPKVINRASDDTASRIDAMLARENLNTVVDPQPIHVSPLNTSRQTYNGGFGLESIVAENRMTRYGGVHNNASGLYNNNASGLYNNNASGLYNNNAVGISLPPTLNNTISRWG